METQQAKKTRHAGETLHSRIIQHTKETRQKRPVQLRQKMQGAPKSQPTEELQLASPQNARLLLIIYFLYPGTILNSSVAEPEPRLPS